MTEERLVLAELLEKAGEGDFLRAVAEAVLQLLMESDLEGLIGAARYERSGECRHVRQTATDGDIPRGALPRMCRFLSAGRGAAIRSDHAPSAYTPAHHRAGSKKASKKSATLGMPRPGLTSIPSGGLSAIADAR